MGVVLALAILGLIFIKNYSTVFCWVAIVAVVLYYLGRKYGLEWYVKRKMTEFPVQEIKGLRLGVQPHGIVMRQKVGLQEGTATIGWKDIYEWYNSPEFILVNFKDYVVLIEQDNNEIPCKITDPICTKQIKSAKLSFTGGSYIKGTAYCLVDPNSNFGNPNLYRVISPLKIFHVETIGCSNQKNTKPFNYK